MTIVTDNDVLSAIREFDAKYFGENNWCDYDANVVALINKDYRVAYRDQIMMRAYEIALERG